MNVKINNTNIIVSLTATDPDTGIEWTQDMIGNTGAMNDGQFVWSEEDNAYLADQETYDWWDRYITQYNRTCDEVQELASEFGIDESIIYDRIADMTNHHDYETHRRSALLAMHDIRAELSN